MLRVIPHAQKLLQGLAQAAHEVLLLTLQTELCRQKHHRTHSPRPLPVLPLIPILVTTTPLVTGRAEGRRALRLACRVE